jgi:hypothetical protein
MVIPDFFKEFLRNVIQENSSMSMEDFNALKMTLLSSLQLAKVIAIPKLEI